MALSYARAAGGSTPARLVHRRRQVAPRAAGVYLLAIMMMSFSIASAFFLA